MLLLLFYDLKKKQQPKTKTQTPKKPQQNNK